MRRTGFILASVTILAASSAAWWWCSGDATHVAATALAEEGGGARTESASAASIASKGAPADADRKEGVDGFDEKRDARIATRELRIRVVDEVGRTPIEGATISLDPSDWAGRPPAAEARSGSDGMATFAVPNQEMVHLAVTAQGFAPVVELIPVELAGTREKPIEVALDRGASIHGQLIDATGAPVVGASVHIDFQRIIVGGNVMTTDFAYSRKSYWLAPPKRTEAKSDDSGRFVFEDLAADVETRLVEDDRNPPLESMHVLLEPGERRELVWRLHAKCSIHGRVVDGDGRPVADAIVSAFQNLSPSNPTSEACATTDLAGEFELPRLRPGGCVLEVEAREASHATGSFACDLAPGERRSDVVLELPRARPLVVRARLPDGSAPEKVFATVTSREHGGDARYTERLDATGNATTFRAIPLGAVDVEIRARNGSATMTGRVLFRHDGDHECVVECVAVSGVRGSIELADHSSPPPVASVALLERRADRGEAIPIASTATKYDAFDLSSVPAGEYDLVATLPEGFAGFVSSLRLAPGATLEGVRIVVAPAATLIVTAPLLQEGAARTYSKSGRFQIQVRSGRAVVGVVPLGPSEHDTLTVPSGRLTVEVWLAGELLASRDVEAQAGKVVRARF